MVGNAKKGRIQGLYKIRWPYRKMKPCCRFGKEIFVRIAVIIFPRGRELEAVARHGAVSVR